MRRVFWLALVGSLVAPIGSGWFGPSWSAVSSALDFYRAIHLAEGGETDAAVDLFRSAFAHPRRTVTTFQTAEPPATACARVVRIRYEYLGPHPERRRPKKIRASDCL